MRVFAAAGLGMASSRPLLVDIVVLRDWLGSDIPVQPLSLNIKLLALYFSRVVYFQPLARFQPCIIHTILLFRLLPAVLIVYPQNYILRTVSGRAITICSP